MTKQDDLVLGPGDDYVHAEPAFESVRRRLEPTDTVLDIGCGFGNVGRYFMQAGVTVDGIEPDPDRSASAASVLRHVCRGSLEQALEDDQLRSEYSVVTVLDVVEHFVDPLEALLQAKRFLAPEGRLFLFVPNSAHWSFRRKILKGDWSYSDSGLFDRTHLRFFDLRTTTDLIRAAGLVERDREYTSPYASRAVELGLRRMPTLFALHFLFELVADG